MTEKEQKEIEKLKSINAASLPDNMESSRLSSTNIKRKFYDGELYLLSLIRDIRNNLADGTTIVLKAEKDANGNNIVTTYGTKSEINNLQQQINQISSYIIPEQLIYGHINNTSNPHSVTKAQIGLSSVDNTSDLNKPISNATQTALDGKIGYIVPTSNTEIVYSTKKENNVVTNGYIEISNIPTANHIPKYDTNGNIQTENIQNDGSDIDGKNVVNKKFINDMSILASEIENLFN